MKNKIFLSVICLLAVLSLQAQTNERYIEVTGTSEIEIVPDKIHYLIEIREYFKEEFDGKSKPEEYRTKVPLSEIEQGLREALPTQTFHKMLFARKKSVTIGGNKGRTSWFPRNLTLH